MYESIDINIYVSVSGELLKELVRRSDKHSITRGRTGDRIRAILDDAILEKLNDWGDQFGVDITDGVYIRSDVTEKS